MADDTTQTAAAPDYAALLQAAYQNQLGRAPDTSGAAYWTQQLQSGQITPDQIDAIFAASPEGTLRAQTGQTYNPEYVNAVNTAYKNELGRDTDQSGFNYWLNQLQGGQMQQNLLGQAFSNTPEGLKYDVSQLVGGNVPSTDYVDPNVQKYYSLLPSEYQKYLYRAPDVSGATYWTQQLQSGAVKPADLDKIFSTSPEGQVQSAYQSTLGHTADPAGLANWLGRLGAGSSQADIINALKQTPEYQKLHPYTGTTTQSGATTTAGQAKTATLEQLNQEAAATGMGRRFTPAEMDAFYSYGQRPEHVFYKPVEQTTTTTTTTP